MSNTVNKVLVSDFDGTLTRRDFYALAVAHLLPDDVPNYWADYRAGRITHFETLRNYFAAIRRDEVEVLQWVDRMELDPRLADSLQQLQQAGWQVVVASAGCRWYIDRLLAQAGVSLPVHANLGEFVPGRGLRMRPPEGSPFYSATHGIDKAAVVRHYVDLGCTVAFAGDGFPDEPAARLVPDELRFARGDLAHVLKQHDVPFWPFEVWSEVARQIVTM
jgi:2,3-diketo-5-methylthio-1-phosphopentane phosphatase